MHALQEQGYKSSVDSADPTSCCAAAKPEPISCSASTSDTLHIADQVASTPVLIPKEHGDMHSSIAPWMRSTPRGVTYLADPVLDPINFGFMQSLERYARVRRERPNVEMLMGTGNLTELTDADTTGTTAMLLGIASELHIKNVLVVQVSPHTRRTDEEHDLARRMMFASRADKSCRRIIPTACCVSTTRPFPQSPEEIEQAAREVRDKNFRIEIAEDGIHVYNRDGHHVAQDAFALYDKLGVDSDGPHAFYLGAELARAEIAWRLAKRYAQDEPLDWGVAADAPVDDRTRLKEAGHTLIAKKKREAS